MAIERAIELPSTPYLRRRHRQSNWIGEGKGRNGEGKYGKVGGDTAR